KAKKKYSFSLKASVFFLCCHLCFFDSGTPGKILVWPVDFSHWIGLKVILNQLQLHGHEITILIPSPSYLFDHTKIPFNVEILQLPVTKETIMEELDTFLHMVSFELPKLSWWDRQAKLREMSHSFLRMGKRVCNGAITNKELLSRLQAAKFDICVADPLSFCGELLAELLNIPLIYSFRFSYGNVIERLCAQFPIPSSILISYVKYKYLSDRIKTLKSTLNYYLRSGDSMAKRYYFVMKISESTTMTQKTTTLCEIMGKAKMWLIRTYWDFEFPHPYLPNFEFVGGLHCKPAKPLPKELEEFVQSSGKDGVVANIIASALAQIPQKVLWKYTGKKPDTLGPNTQLYEWIPQNDLLGHPKTKAFITHCGTNGIYEAIYHGIPMVGIPIFGDQLGNIARIKAKGTAVEVDLHTMTSSNLLNALKEVINNPSYKENAMKLSRIHHDQPIKPLDRAVFWIEYVMRHQGAKHLRPASHDLTWFQYHSLDVIGFLLACVATTIFLVTKCLFCCWKFGKTGKKNKRE
uniref:UDP-glucuronosyltransferase n=1 Tax=Canis lupus familiaris TaxID=9615 RepID=A0A8C0PPF6_CANLF